MKKLHLLSLILILISNIGQSQFYESGQDPFSISWKQIKTKNYQLIFPEGFEEYAQKYASTLDTIYPVIGKFLINKPKPVSVVFHTQSSLSNGMVVYAPKRMELYTIPPQDNYPQDWLDQLALHETRHVAQLDALNKGITRLGSFLIGEQAVGAISGMVPRWFLEGDAVYSETMFSNSGRGRSAAFKMPYRALVLSKKKLYSYEKAMLGSYRNFVPDIYRMGYPMVKMMRDSFAPDIFGKSLNFTARNPYLLFPFGHSLKKNSGLNNRFVYEFTFNNLKEKWTKQDQAKEYQYWPTNNKNVLANYNFPYLLENSKVLSQKWSYTQTRRIVTIDKNGKEKKIVSTGTNSGERLSVAGTKITWSENRNDLRWSNRLYSEVMVFDIETKKLKRLSRKTFFFSPAFSPDAKFIAVIEETPDYKSSLIILDSNSGEIVKKMEAPHKNHLQQPLWTKENEIYCLSVSENGKSIIKLTNVDLWEVVIPPSFKNISSFCFADTLLIVAGEHNDINNLFSFNTKNRQFSQITNSKFGAFEPFFDTNTQQLYFSDYTSDGYKIASESWPSKTYREINNYSYENINSDSTLFKGFNLQAGTNDNKNYPVTNYSKLSHLFNIHSWLPAYYNYSVSDISNPNIYPGFMLLSQNLLGNMISTFGYSFEHGDSHLHANLSFKALFPVISWNIDAGGPVNRIGGNTSVPVNFSRNIQSTVNISLPLNFSHTNISSALIPYAEWKYNRNAYYLQSEKKYYQELSQINWGLNYYRYTRMAIRDLYPRAGFSSFFKLQTSPFENKLISDIYALSLRLYLPGIVRPHSFQIRYGYQYQSSLVYSFSSILAFPSGYLSSGKGTLQVLNFNYALPLFYPDIHAGPIFYLKRIRANFFYDMANHNYRKNGIITAENLRSLGTDLIADVHILRIMFPFQLGAKFSYLPDEKKLITQAIFSVNLVY